MATPDSVRAAINDLHQAIADHTDPQSKQMLTQALQIAMKVQATDYANHADTQDAAQTVATALNRPGVPQ